MLHFYDNRKHTISQTDSCLIEGIKQFSSKPLKNLVKENPSLLIFPQCIEESEDKIGDSFLFEIDCDFDTSTKFDDCKFNHQGFIKTSNAMGFFSVGKTSISIHSRFDDNFDEKSETTKDFFLNYMLSKVFFPNIVDLPHDFGNGYLNLLIFAFPYLLKNALSQGVYKEYLTKDYNDANFRGTISVSQHIQQNPLFNGRVAYKTREQVFDNKITELIRHTIEFIKESQFSSILMTDFETQNAISKIIENTHSYQKNKRNEIVMQNQKPVIHSLYSRYLPLQKLCLQILRFDKNTFENEDDGLCGILFDGAWLWEEYLATILKKFDFIHPENKNRLGGIQMFENENFDDDSNNDFNEEFSKNFRKIYPDFYKENIVLDAKYKNLKNGLIREDIYQLISYMHILKAQIGGFIFPQKESDEEKLCFNYKLKGLGGLLKSIPLTIPQNAKTMEEFVTQISEEEKNFLR